MIRYVDAGAGVWVNLYFQKKEGILLLVVPVVNRKMLLNTEQQENIWGIFDFQGAIAPSVGLVAR